MTVPDAQHPTAAEPLRLGFARGVSPNKWARRWAELTAQSGAAPLELVPLDLTGRIERDYITRLKLRNNAEHGSLSEIEIDVTLERVSPGDQPAGTGGAEPLRSAVKLYTESVALVIAADQELAEQQTVDRETLTLVTLLAHPDHLASWPASQTWREESWAPKDAAAAIEIVATGAGAILLPLPLARHLAGKRSHAVLPVVGDPARPGTEIWASWRIDRDDAEVQQLVGVLRGRSARSGRGSLPNAQAASERSAPKRQAQNRAKKQKPLPKNSRGAQLAAAKAARESGQKRSSSAGKTRKRGGR